jgi:membrane-associated phospholipid phosphatase
MLDPSEHRFLISMIMLGVASLVAYSRIETGIHSALEVVYGGLLGAGVTLVVFQVFG